MCGIHFLGVFLTTASKTFDWCPCRLRRSTNQLLYFNLKNLCTPGNLDPLKCMGKKGCQLFLSNHLYFSAQTQTTWILSVLFSAVPYSEQVNLCETQKTLPGLNGIKMEIYRSGICINSSELQSMSRTVPRSWHSSVGETCYMHHIRPGKQRVLDQTTNPSIFTPV